MFARFGHALLIVALLGATGTHWAVLQSVAWATMLADNAKCETLGGAIVKTFDGKHPCPLCKQIAQGRQSEKKTDLQLNLKKLEFCQQTSQFIIASPSHFFLLNEHRASAALLFPTPPVPPPRTLPG